MYPTRKMGESPMELKNKMFLLPALNSCGIGLAITHSLQVQVPILS